MTEKTYEGNDVSPDLEIPWFLCIGRTNRDLLIKSIRKQLKQGKVLDSLQRVEQIKKTVFKSAIGKNPGSTVSYNHGITGCILRQE